jgi:adenine-specific DNA-methyltransferase
VGRKGRTRLAVLDGMLTTGVADHLLEQLGERENLVVVAMTLEEGVAEHLRKQRPGSRARKVPRDLARSGKLAPRLVRLEREAQLGDGR